MVKNMPGRVLRMWKNLVDYDNIFLYCLHFHLIKAQQITSLHIP